MGRTPLHGWPPTLAAVAAGAGRRNAETEAPIRHSILALYTRLLAIRRSSPALELGDWLLLDSPAGTLVYERSWEGDARRVAVNFGDRRVPDVAAADGWNVEITTERGRDGRPWDGIPRAGRGGHSHAPACTIRR